MVALLYEPDLEPDIKPNPVVRVDAVDFSYGEGESRNQVLFDIHLAVQPGELVVMTGPSGSGKTTLLTLIGALRSALPDQVRVLTKPQLVAFESDFQADLSSAGPIFWMGTVVGFVVGMLISYQIIYTDLSDQLPQYATLKGMGYENFYLVRVVIEQAALSALAGYVPAWLLCLVVYRVIGAVALLPLQMTLKLTLISLGLTLGMCLLSAILAIRRVIAADPAEVF